MEIEKALGLVDKSLSITILLVILILLVRIVWPRFERHLTTIDSTMLLILKAVRKRRCRYRRRKSNAKRLQNLPGGCGSDRPISVSIESGPS